MVSLSKWRNSRCDPSNKKRRGASHIKRKGLGNVLQSSLAPKRNRITRRQKSPPQGENAPGRFQGRNKRLVYWPQFQRLLAERNDIFLSIAGGGGMLTCGMGIGIWHLQGWRYGPSCRDTLLADRYRPPHPRIAKRVLAKKHTPTRHQ